ncbi:unnamed protein product [Lampetra fluviatilis]
MAGPNGEPSSIASEDASEDALLEGDEGERRGSAVVIRGHNVERDNSSSTPPPLGNAAARSPRPPWLGSHHPLHFVERISGQFHGVFLFTRPQLPVSAYCEGRCTLCVLYTEYQDLNSALDQISSFLDQLEERNDSLNARLRELLASNQQERRGASSEAQGTQQQNER